MIDLEKLIKLESQSSFTKGAVIFFLLGVIATLLLLPSKKPRTEVCKSEIHQVKVLSTQLAKLRLDFSKEKTKILTDCKHEMREESLKKLKAYKAVCEELRCEICQKGNKR